jgi:hypothetical protein
MSITKALLTHAGSEARKQGNMPHCIRTIALMSNHSLADILHLNAGIDFNDPALVNSAYVQTTMSLYKTESSKSESANNSLARTPKSMLSTKIHTLSKTQTEGNLSPSNEGSKIPRSAAHYSGPRRYEKRAADRCTSYLLAPRWRGRMAESLQIREFSHAYEIIFKSPCCETGLENNEDCDHSVCHKHF